MKVGIPCGLSDCKWWDSKANRPLCTIDREFLSKLLHDRAVVKYLIVGVVVLLEVGMRERFLDGDALVWVEGQHAVQQVECACVCAREQLGPWHAWLERQRLKVPTSLCKKKQRYLVATGVHKSILLERSKGIILIIIEVCLNQWRYWMYFTFFFV